MKRFHTRRRTNRRAFTLVEMLVVLAILVLLVGMVAPRVLKSQKKADINNAKAQIGMFRTCLERYAVDMKDFPTTEQGLAALVQPPDDSAATSVDSFDSGETTGLGGGSGGNWDGPYINQDAIPKDPWGNDYQYEYPPTHGAGEYPDIWSFGPDGEDGTEDDIVSWSTTNEENQGMSPVDEPPPLPED